MSAAPCSLHTYHRPRNVTIEFHHVIPQAWQLTWAPPGSPAGVLWDKRTVACCPTGHRNIHAGIVALMHHTPPPGGRAERACAQLALTRFVAAGGDLDMLRSVREWGQS